VFQSKCPIEDAPSGNFSRWLFRELLAEQPLATIDLQRGEARLSHLDIMLRSIEARAAPPITYR
jgi:hypothetical protein